MVYTDIEDICKTMIDEKLRYARAYIDGGMIYKQDLKIDPSVAAEQLENFIGRLLVDGNGKVEVKLYEMNSKDTPGGGKVQPIYSFNIKLGKGKGGDGVEGLRSTNYGREKELESEITTLRNRNDELKDLIKEYELDKRIKELVEPLKKKIAGLEEKQPSDDGGGLRDLVDLCKPYMPQIVGKFFPGVSVPAALAENVSEVSSEANTELLSERFKNFQLHERIDSATEELEEIFGAEKVAELFSILVEKAKADPVKFESYFPILKSL